MRDGRARAVAAAVIAAAASMGVLPNPAAAQVLAIWDGTDNPWQSPHWTYSPPSPDPYPNNRPDQTFDVDIFGGTVTLLEPVAVDRIDLFGTAPPAPATLLTGSFNVTTPSFRMDNAVVRGTGTIRVGILGIENRPGTMAIIDGVTIDAGSPLVDPPLVASLFDRSGPLQLDNGAVINSHDRFVIEHNGAISGSGGAINNYGQLDVNYATFIGPGLEFGPTIAFNNFGALRTPQPLFIRGGGSSSGTWEAGALTVFDCGTREFTLESSVGFGATELRSGTLTVNAPQRCIGFNMSGGALRGSGDLDVATGPFVWSAGPISGSGEIFLNFADRSQILDSGAKSLSGRRLVVGDRSLLSYTSDSDLLMSDGATIEVIHDAVLHPFQDPGRMVLGPVRGASLGALRYAGGATPAVINGGLLQVLSPIDFVGVPFTNRDEGLLTVDALGHLRTDAALALDPGSTTLLLEGRISSALPVDNQGTLLGSGILDAEFINTGRLQVGSFTPEADALMFIELNGQLTLKPTSTLRFPLLGRIARDEYGVIDVNGIAAFAGELQFDLGSAGGAGLVDGDILTLLTADKPIPGLFTNVAPGEPYPGTSLKVFYGVTSPFGADRLVVVVPEPAAALLLLPAVAAWRGARRRARMLGA